MPSIHRIKTGLQSNESNSICVRWPLSVTLFQEQETILYKCLAGTMERMLYRLLRLEHGTGQIYSVSVRPSIDYRPELSFFEVETETNRSNVNSAIESIMNVLAQCSEENNASKHAFRCYKEDIKSRIAKSDIYDTPSQIIDNLGHLIIWRREHMSIEERNTMHTNTSFSEAQKVAHALLQKNAFAVIGT